MKSKYSDRYRSTTDRIFTTEFLGHRKVEHYDGRSYTSDVLNDLSSLYPPHTSPLLVPCPDLLSVLTIVHANKVTGIESVYRG